MFESTFARRLATLAALIVACDRPTITIHVTREDHATRLAILPCDYGATCFTRDVFTQGTKADTQTVGIYAPKASTSLLTQWHRVAPSRCDALRIPTDRPLEFNVTVPKDAAAPIIVDGCATCGAVSVCPDVSGGDGGPDGGSDGGPIGCQPTDGGWAACLISAGMLHTCAITDARRVKCWGNNANGELGAPDGSSSATPIDVAFPAAVASVAACESFTCAVTGDGRVWCWGKNDSGQLGISDGGSATPTVVPGVNGALAVTCGKYHGCALIDGGSVSCWGDNGSFALGLDGGVTRSLAVTVPRLPPVVSVSSGGRHNCALTADGGPVCWGENSLGQLGDGTSNSSDRPVQVSGVSGVVAVSAGTDHSCALLRNGGVKCWGQNLSGELGNADAGSGSLNAVDVLGLTNANAISAGEKYTCAVTIDGGVLCWGTDSNGELGDGLTGLGGPLPVSVPGVSSDYVGVSTGQMHVCAVTRRGQAKCWGSNFLGQLGNGTKSAIKGPVDVVQAP
jgi:alpha-tubulin suppressor-like RCC1 family protein